MKKNIQNAGGLQEPSSAESFTCPAKLISADTCVEGEVAFASKSSLLFKHRSGAFPENAQSFTSIEIQLKHNKVQLGQCSFITPPPNAYFDGRLIFTNEVYDIGELFSEEKVVNLNTYFSTLPFILQQKTKVNAKFKDYTSGLNYDLNAYKSFFDRIYLDYCGEEAEIYEKIENIIYQKEGKKFFSFLNEKLAELENLTKNYTPAEHQTHAYYLRRQFWSFITMSKILYRTNTKPRGYPGDSATLNLIYDNEYVGDNIFSRLLHKHPLEAPAAAAVRNRKTFIADQINELHSKLRPSNKTKLEILSIACGPVRELEELLRSPEDFDRYSFTFLDQDNNALLDAKETINRIEQKFSKKVHYIFHMESVRTIMRVAHPENGIGKFDFIYSMGLYDYLADRMAKRLTEHLYQMLKPGGHLTIGNYHINNPSRTYMEYWLDWVLCYRNEEEFLALSKDLENSTCTLEFEPTRSQMFTIIQREK
ncbi:MAG: class I SAM-dependent methyltransferase [Spirochaetia bacterium]|nr:class I SAM-dependent methyltransferase [Spirochaetia bacterium]